MRLFLILLCSFICCFEGHAQFDERFANQGSLEASVFDFDEVIQVEKFGDDYYALISSFNYLQGRFTYVTSLLKFDKNGELDESYGQDGLLRVSSTEYTFLNPTAMDIDSEGNVFITAQTEPAMGVRSAVIKLRATGEIDTNFGNDGFFVFELYGIANLPDEILIDDQGDILVVGTIIDPNELFDYFPLVFKLKPEGQLDTEFGTNGHLQLFEVENRSDEQLKHAVGGSVNGICLHHDGGYMITGEIGDRTDILDFIAHISEDGVLDESMGTNGYVIPQMDNDFSVFQSVIRVGEQYLVNGSQSRRPFKIGFGVYDERGFSYQEIAAIGKEEFFGSWMVNDQDEIFLVGRSIDATTYSIASYSDDILIAKLSSDLDVEFVLRLSTALPTEVGTVSGCFVDDQKVILGGKRYDGSLTDGYITKLNIDPLVGLDEDNSSLGIDLFPIPTHGELNLVSEFQGEVLLLDSTGKNVKSMVKRSREMILDIGDLPAGAYYLNLNGIHRAIYKY